MYQPNDGLPRTHSSHQQPAVRKTGRPYHPSSKRSPHNNHTRDQIYARTDKRIFPFIRSSKKKKSIPKNTPTHPRSFTPVSLNNRLPREGRRKSPRNAPRRMSRTSTRIPFPSIPRSLHPPSPSSSASTIKIRGTDVPKGLVEAVSVVK
jgi:hypothetical protein